MGCSNFSFKIVKHVEIYKNNKHQVPNKFQIAISKSQIGMTFLQDHEFWDFEFWPL